MFPIKEIKGVLKLSKISADDISKVLGIWSNPSFIDIKCGIFLKLKDNRCAYICFSHHEPQERVFCNMVMYFEKQPSLANLEQSNTMFALRKNWLTDSSSLKEARTEVYRLKTFKHPPKAIFDSTPTDSPVTSRTPSPIEEVPLQNKEYVDLEECRQIIPRTVFGGCTS